ncbi:MAG: ABC transporter permease [Peptostreptococcaceae bacterium]|nr:ABC transporter permease [Peptostreptococcaceae bacterium]
MSGAKIKNFIIDNIVTIIFVLISALGIAVANQPILFIVNEMVQRIARNSFIVMALIIPVLAGLGLNFSITIGAMAGQMAIIMVTDWGIGGIPGILIAMAISVPLSWLFGWMIGKLLNKTRGQEMIASMIVGFFANGLYQFLYLFVVGKFIPMRKKELLLRSGIGVRNTVDLENGLSYAFDNLVKTPFFITIMIVAAFLIALQLIKFRQERNTPLFDRKKFITWLSIFLVIFAFAALAHYTKIMPNSIRILKGIKVPFVTILLIMAVAIFNVWITKTKLGQDFRSVGQSQHIAAVSGIHVDKTRVTAITISTILAAWGQIILLQNVGVLNTFGSHMQIGLFSVAALLVGGASVNKATVGQAFLGVILFHILFLVSPYAGKELFGDAQIGEYFRTFVAYGVIGLSLGLYAWKQAKGLVR